jgi:hypothetical protein
MSSRTVSTFSVVFLVLGPPERPLSSTDTQLALKRERHSKTAVRLEECSPKASHNISRVSVANLPIFKQNLVHALLDFVIHRRQNETRSRKDTRIKTMHVQRAVSRGILMQQACGSVTLATPLIFFRRGSYNNNFPMPPRSLADMNHRFGGTYCIRLDVK